MYLDVLRLYYNLSGANMQAGPGTSHNNLEIYDVPEEKETRLQALMPSKPKNGAKQYTEHHESRVVLNRLQQ